MLQFYPCLPASCKCPAEQALGSARLCPSIVGCSQPQAATYTAMKMSLRMSPSPEFLRACTLHAGPVRSTRCSRKQLLVLAKSTAIERAGRQLLGQFFCCRALRGLLTGYGTQSCEPLSQALTRAYPHTLAVLVHVHLTCPLSAAMVSCLSAVSVLPSDPSK